VASRGDGASVIFVARRWLSFIEMKRSGTGKREKEMPDFQILPIFVGLRAIPISHALHIFIGDATSSMNIVHVYSSGT
jgi:hypothetical protein